jgi:hypothetical protein
VLKIASLNILSQIGIKFVMKDNEEDMDCANIESF